MPLTSDFQARKDAILRRNKPAAGPDLCLRHEAPAPLKDVLGNVWCTACRVRYDLIQWGHAHHYPDVYVHPYSIAAGEDMWKHIARVGRSDAIEAIMDGLRRVPEEEVSA